MLKQGRWPGFFQDIAPSCRESAPLCEVSMGILEQLCEEVCTFSHIMSSPIACSGIALASLA